MILLFLLAVVPSPGSSKDLDIFYGRNPYGWEDDKRILYDYKGFFDPMIELVKDETKSWDWAEGDNSDVAPNVNMETLVTANRDFKARTVVNGRSLRRILELNEEQRLDGIIGVSGSAEAAYCAAMFNVTYIHTYSDSSSAKILNTDGENKPKGLNTIRIGIPTNFVANAMLDLIDWLDDSKSAKKSVNLMVFHEMSYASEKIANQIKINTVNRHSDWTVNSMAYTLDIFDGASSDREYFLAEDSKISGDYFDTYCKDALNETRAVVIVGSIGFIRQTAISLHRATINTDVDYKEFVIFSIPATLWPKPSFKAADMMQLNSEMYKDDEDIIAKNAFQNMFVITESFDEAKYDSLSTTIKEEFFKDQPHMNYSTDWTKNRPVPLWSGYTYDGMLLLMKAIQKVADPADYYDYLIDKTWTATDFGGIKPFSGDIKIDENGDREWKLKFWRFNDKQTWVEIAETKSTRNPNFKKTGNKPKLVNLYPKCGYAGCAEYPHKQLLMVALIIAICLALLCILVPLLMKRSREQKSVMEMGWRVNFGDLVVDDHDVDDAFSIGDLSESSGSIGAVAGIVGAGKMMKTESLESLDLLMGQKLSYNNVPVYIKPVLREFFGTNNLALLKELKYLKDLEDDFIVSYIGLTRDDLSYCWLVLEMCHKGTLEDALQDDSVELDSNFKISMIDDIAAGMHFLHNKTNLGSHGNLTTSNVLISNNFTMKIANFGKSVFLSDMKKIHHHSEIERNKRILWRAPELLRKKRVNINGTKSGDVYSFAIIVHEIITRQGPFNLRSMENKETATTIILKVKAADTTEPYRPVFLENIRHKPLKKMATKTTSSWWAENENQRDNFKKICDIIKVAKPGKSNTASFLDTAVKRMEKFSGALAKKAEDRELQARAEEKKVEELKEYFIPKVLLKDGLDAYVPEVVENTTVAVIELAGLTQATSRGKSISDIIALETKYRNLLDTIANKSAFYFGQGSRVHRVWVASRSCNKQHSHHHSTVKVVQQIMRKMEKIIEEDKMKDAYVSVKAGMHTGVIKTGLIGHHEHCVPLFDFMGAEEADMLCSVSQAFEILVSPEAHAVIQQIAEKDIVLDFGAKQQYDSGTFLEAYCLKY